MNNNRSFAKHHGTVSRNHPLVFVLAGLFSLSTVITGGYLSLFTTGSLNSSLVLDYVTLAFLNIAALPLAQLGIVNSQPWWVWYILAFKWIGLATSGWLLYRQITGTLDQSSLQAVKSVLVESFLWTAIGLTFASAVTYGLGWSLQQGAELLYAISASFLSLPIAIFTPLMDFNIEVWVLVLLLWIAKYKLDI